MKEHIWYLIFILSTTSCVVCGGGYLVPNPDRGNISITYNANGATEGTIPKDERMYRKGDVIIILANTGNLKNGSHPFIAWNTKANGSGDQLLPGNSLLVSGFNISLYAIYESLTYSVVYNENGSTLGSVPQDSKAYKKGDTVVVLENSGLLVRGSEVFATWNTEANGNGTSYAPNSTLIMGESNIILYALYRSNQIKDYTITTFSKLEDYPRGMAFTSNGDIIVATDWRLYKILNTGKIEVFAGNGKRGYAGDGKDATLAEMDIAMDVEIDSQDRIYFSDLRNGVIRKIDKGIITTFAGNGKQQYSGDKGPAIKASMNWPHGLAIDSSGNVYIAEERSNRIRKVDSSTNIITTYYGNGDKAILGQPKGIFFDKDNNNLYIADWLNNRIVKVNPNGTGTIAISSIDEPSDVVVDTEGSLFVAAIGMDQIFAFPAENSKLIPIAGNGYTYYSGDGGPAIKASLHAPSSIVRKSNGDIYISDEGNKAIRKLAPTP